MADPSPLRAVRAAAFAAVCVGISAVGHATTSGHGVPAGGPLVTALPVFGLAYAGTRRERGFATVAVQRRGRADPLISTRMCFIRGWPLCGLKSPSGRRAFISGMYPVAQPRGMS